MTRDEAIAILEVSKHMATSGRMYNQAIDMAIEALSAPSGDLISRADAMGAVQDHFNADGFKGYNDGQQMMDRINALPSAEQVTSKLNNPCNSLLTDGSNGSKEHKSKLDLISRQDVIEALCRSSIYAWSIEQDQTAHDWALNIIKAIPSADAMPTVIRSKTFMRKEDFNKWADDIKKQNKNIVCIPCDAEVVSADAVSREVKEDDKFNTCNNNNNNADADYKSHLIDLLKARKQFFVDAYGGSFHCMSEKDKARCDEIDACIASIVNAPTDAESVVRCKDCKYSFYDKDYESYNCRKHEYVECFDADDYCSWGERND